MLLFSKVMLRTACAGACGDSRIMDVVVSVGFAFLPITITWDGPIVGELGGIGQSPLGQAKQFGSGGIETSPDGL